MTPISSAPRVSTAWNLFSYANFAIALVMMAIGIWSLEASFTAKGYFAMATLMLIYTTAAISKALRDKEEAAKIYNRIEEARTERLLAETTGK